ncbi:response regulator [Candidatus Arthromitus sp. SFB-mouse-NYU]|nr:response regulator [Candidatus Arthromitus sp. SFB-mouse-NYU]BAK80170.1 two component transcriptional regulator, winged helix family [Candidatus Arthromitus sp. SFB-mouse-Yit]
MFLGKFLVGDGIQKMYRILIVEDDFRIADAIKDKMKMWDLDLHIVEDFRTVLNDFKFYNPHIVLLDISLPFFDGYHWCGEIRKISKVPIIFISSASDNMNIVMAMNMGADDFIAKPFDMNVLVAKVQAMLRRAYDFTSNILMLEHRGAFLNMEDNTLMINNNTITLTKNEYRILLCLMENKGKVVSREKLMERLWKTESFIDENTLTVNVNRLRKKLDSSGLENFITTKVGVGYIVE